MKPAREQTLLQMGLGPLWKLRAPVVVQSAPAMAAPAAEVEEARTELPDNVTVVMTDSGVPSMDWDTLESTVKACTKCRLCEQRKQAVFGVGDRQADWLFVGEGPGAEEDQRGEPFVGQAGKLLDNMLASISLKRGTDVYIANAVKCRPPGNRTPQADEMDACHPYLERQIALIRPRLIVALGRPAAQTLLEREIKVGAERGKLHRYHDIPLIVTYHPAYLLRNLPEKAKAWEDLCFMRSTMSQLKEKG